MPPNRWREHVAPLAWLLLVAFVPFGLGPWTGRVPWFSDIVNVDHPIRAYVGACIGRGEFPFWNPHSACGLPFVADANTALFYPTTWLLCALAPPIAMAVDLVLHLFVAGALTYAVARVRGAGSVAAAFAGTAFALGGAVFTEIQLPGNLRALALTPALVLGAALIARRLAAAGFVVAALGWALALLAGHPQLAFCAVPVAVAVSMDGGDAPLRDRLRWLALLAGAVAVGTAIAAVQLAPAMEFVRISQRSLGISRELIDAGSMSAGDLARTVYARSQFTAHVAVGAAVPLLAGLAAVLRTKSSAALLAAAAFGTLAALGAATPVGRALQSVPPYEYFQMPSRHFASASLALALLAGHGLDAWREGASTPRARAALVAALTALVAGAYFTSTGEPSIHDVPKLAVLAAVAALFAVGPGRAPRVRAAAFVALAAAHLAVENGRAYWRDEHLATPATAAAVPADLAATPPDARDGTFRLLTANTTTDGQWHWHNRPTAFGMDNARGHVAFLPLRFLDLSHVVNHGVPFPRTPIRTPLYSYAPRPGDSPLLDLFAVRYAMGMQRPPGTDWRETAPRVYERACRVREAAFVRDARFVADVDAAAAVLRAPDFDPTKTVVVEGEGASEAEEDARADARVVEIERDAGGVRVRLEPGRAGWLVANWNSLPGFTATVDGRPADIRRANIAFMAVRLPADAREVRLRYRPPGLVAGAWISVAGIASLAAAAWRLRRRAPVVAEEEPRP